MPCTVFVAIAQQQLGIAHAAQPVHTHEPFPPLFVRMQTAAINYLQESNRGSRVEVRKWKMTRVPQGSGQVLIQTAAMAHIISSDYI